MPEYIVEGKTTKLCLEMPDRRTLVKHIKREYPELWAEPPTIKMVRKVDETRAPRMAQTLMLDKSGRDFRPECPHQEHLRCSEPRSMCNSCRGLPSKIQQ